MNRAKRRPEPTSILTARRTVERLLYDVPCPVRGFVAVVATLFPDLHDQSHALFRPHVDEWQLHGETQCRQAYLRKRLA